MVRVGTCLEGDQIIGVPLHVGQPVDNKLVGLPAVQTQSGQGVLQKGGGVPAWYAEALGEVIFRPADALPVEVIVGLTDRVRQRPVGAGGDHPGISIHDGINTGQFPVIVQGNGDIGLRLRIEVDDRLCVGSASRRRTAGEQR